MMGPPPAGSRATLKSQLLATSTAVTRNLSCPVCVPSPNSSDVLPMPSEMTSPGRHVQPPFAHVHHHHAPDRRPAAPPSLLPGPLAAGRAPRARPTLFPVR